MTSIETLTPEQRVTALLYFFGWQGGTIHQLAQETGISSSDLLYKTEKPSNRHDESLGWFAIRTCDLAHRRNVLAPSRKGNWDYWAGAMVAYHI